MRCASSMMIVVLSLPDELLALYPSLSPDASLYSETGLSFPETTSSSTMAVPYSSVSR